MATFYGIGVGPGDPELITLKALNILGQIDVLLIPETKKNEKGIAYQIIEPYIKSTIEEVFIDFPMVADEKAFEKSGMWGAIFIQKSLLEGKNVAFVTLGDPGVYSTYSYLVAALKQLGIADMITIPGITSFCAAAALANRPLVEKDEILTIIPMNAQDDQIHAALEIGDSFAFMKIYHRENRLMKHLENNNLLKQGVLAKRCGFQEASIQTELETVLPMNQDYLTLVLSRKEQEYV